ncbi:glycosyltransferase [Massilia horti]|uniref:Glycosyltransferase n=1 Tax=Massilia horti TaxID=2562153 RepID=A0A4Y9T3C8_9BURK|nr:glycosyltransferase [Massilia horti]TFW33776.1 glycosyltransferase [Massilia horti]
MKILFVHNAYQHFGGEDAVVNAEMDLLRAHGHAVDLYLRNNDELKQLSSAVAATTVIWSRQAARHIRSLCDSFRPDLIHVHNTFALISPSVYWVAAQKNIPVVQTLHNYRLLCPQGTFLRKGSICQDCLGKAPWRAVGRKCYRQSAPQSAVMAGMLGAHRAAGTYRDRVTRYIALTAFARDRFIQGGLPAEKLRVKPNFVDVPVQPAWEARRGGLFVGRLSEEKGTGTLAGAARLLANADIDVIGSGPDEAAVRAQFGPRCHGFLPREAILARMRAASFLIVPSICHEQLPTTLIEAFSCGLPVIASRLGALADLVEDGVTGLLFEPGDAAGLASKIAWAQTHGAELERMGRAARARYEATYTPSINYNMLVRIYEDAMAERDGRRHAP